MDQKHLAAKEHKQRKKGTGKQSALLLDLFVFSAFFVVN
jgi:hypothetical protein